MIIFGNNARTDYSSQIIQNKFSGSTLSKTDSDSCPITKTAGFTFFNFDGYITISI